MGSGGSRSKHGQTEISTQTSIIHPLQVCLTSENGSFMISRHKITKRSPSATSSKNYKNDSCCCGECEHNQLNKTPSCYVEIDTQTYRPDNIEKCSPNSSRRKEPKTVKLQNTNESDDELTEFQEVCLKEHNYYRCLHNCEPLQWSSKLARHAREWAEHLSNAKSVQINPQNVYGENMYVAINICVTGDTPVKSWYAEVSNYNYNKPGFSPNVGHFTQVIWKNSVLLGVGVVTKNNTTWVVAYYFPPGNVLNEFPFNCFPITN